MFRPYGEASRELMVDALIGCQFVMDQRVLDSMINAGFITIQDGAPVWIRSNLELLNVESLTGMYLMVKQMKVSNELS